MKNFIFTEKKNIKKYLSLSFYVSVSPLGKLDDDDDDISSREMCCNEEISHRALIPFISIHIFFLCRMSEWIG